MVNNESHNLDRVFHALSDPTRREILNMLTRQQYTIGELADPFRMSLAAVSKHIKVLEDAGLLTRARDGRIHRCTMNAAPLKEAQNVINFYQNFWENQFRQLDRFLQESMNQIPDDKTVGEKESGKTAKNAASVAVLKGDKNGRRKK
jgi:DNA-binding transcriptional ArsR family regulator